MGPTHPGDASRQDQHPQKQNGNLTKNVGSVDSKYRWTDCLLKRRYMRTLDSELILSAIDSREDYFQTMLGQLWEGQEHPLKIWNSKFSMMRASSSQMKSVRLKMSVASSYQWLFLWIKTYEPSSVFPSESLRFPWGFCSLPNVRVEVKNKIP